MHILQVLENFILSDKFIGWNYICINNLYFFLYSLFLSP